jgi:hypothetical protein
MQPGDHSEESFLRDIFRQMPIMHNRPGPRDGRSAIPLDQGVAGGRIALFAFLTSSIRSLFASVMAFFDSNPAW